MNENKELTRDDIEIDADMEVDCDIGQIVTVYVETWFDVDRKFGVQTADDPYTWVNLYAKYNVPEDSLQMEYIICHPDGKDECHDYVPTEAEAQLIKTMIRDKCAEAHGCTLEEFIEQVNAPEMEGLQ